jgi:hypothetical protein
MKYIYNKIFMPGFLISLILCGAGTSQPALAKHYEDFEFDTAKWTETLIHVDYDGRTLDTVISKIWVKNRGKLQRIEKVREITSTPNQPKTLSFIIIQDHDKYTSAMASAGTQKLTKTNLEAESVLYDEKWITKKNLQKVGTETVDGKECEVYTYDSEHNLGGLVTIRSSVKECRWHGLSLKTISRMLPPPDGSGDSYITILKDVEVNIPIPDELFQIPSDAQIEEKALPTLNPPPLKKQ